MASSQPFVLIVFKKKKKNGDAVPVTVSLKGCWACLDQ